MWGGIVAVLNYIPYLGPIAAALLLFVRRADDFSRPGAALLPPAIFIGLHLIEANVFTPMVVGHKLTINPLLILVSLSLLGMGVGDDRGAARGAAADHHEDGLLGRRTPDIAGFLFEDGTLTHVGEEDEEEDGGAAGIGAGQVDSSGLT